MPAPNPITSGLRDVGRIATIVVHWAPLALLVAVGLFVAALATIRSLEPRYSATSLILIQEKGEGRLARGGAAATASDDLFAIRGEVSILGSRAVAGRVVQALHLAAHPEFADAMTGDPEGAAGRLVDEYADRVTVFNDGRSPVVSVRVSAAEAEFAAELANAHVDAYFALKNQAIGAGLDRVRDRVDDAFERSREELREIESRIERVRNDNGLLLGSIDATRSLLDTELAQLTSAMEEMRNEAERLQAMLDAFEGEAAPELAASPSLQSSAMQLLRSREAEALVAANLAVANFGPEDPARRQAEADLAAIRQAIADETRRVGDGLRAELSRVEAQLRAAQERRNGMMAELRDQNLASAEINALLAEARSRRAFHEALQSERQTALLESGLLGANADIVSRATPQLHPDFPPSNLFIALAALVSGLLGILAALLADALLGHRRPAGEIAERAGLPCMGEVGLPSSGDVRMLQRPRIWGAFRDLRGAVIAGDEDPGIVCLVGVRDDPSATALSVGLAKSIAATGRPTLVIDADVAAPRMPRFLRLGDEMPGLTEILSGGIDLAHAIVNGGQRNFDVLAPGRGGPEVAEALWSDALRSTLHRTREAYRLVVVKAPAMGRLTDALPILHVADRVVLVLPAGRHALAALTAASERLRGAGVEPAGFILVRRARGRLPGFGGSPAAAAPVAEEPLRLHGSGSAARHD